MNDYEQLDQSEKQHYAQFKRQLNLQAAEAQIGKIEYDMLDATASLAAVKSVCQDANALKLGAICVLPNMVKPCVANLGTNTKTSLIACISYPHGGDTTASKSAMVKNAIKDGVDEVEVTAPVSYIKDGNWGLVKKEFKKVRRAAKKRAVRINIESHLLTPQEITKVCKVAADCGITSLRASGYCGFDAEVITLIKNTVKDKCTIKADKINNFIDMKNAVDMGAGIIGSNNAVELARRIIQTAEE